MKQETILTVEDLMNFDTEESMFSLDENSLCTLCSVTCPNITTLPPY